MNKCSPPTGWAAGRDGAYVNLWRVLRFHVKEEAMSYAIAGIDVHKRVLMVAVTDVSATDQFECRTFGSTVSELRRMVAWLTKREVQELVAKKRAQVRTTITAVQRGTSTCAGCWTR